VQVSLAAAMRARTPERAAPGIPEGPMRFSSGIEDADDPIAERDAAP
jgi:cystathionine beta-lyase/cystathionine gamma-synthase